MHPFLNYLRSKRNFLIIWLLFHCFALFVNYFGIEGSTGEQTNLVGTTYYTQGGHLFTTNRFSPNSKDFWPFVEFVNHVDHGTEYYLDHLHTDEVTFFNGIFYEYDISEFLAYNVLLIVVLYFVFNSKKEKPNETI